MDEAWGVGRGVGSVGQLSRTISQAKSPLIGAHKSAMLQSLLQIAAADSPDRGADLAAPRCIPRAHSRCRRPSATVAACPCAARQGMEHVLPTSLPDDAAAMVARASIALATTDGARDDAAVDVADAAALPASVMSSSTSSSASCRTRLANTAGHWVQPRMRKTPTSAAALAAVDGAAAAVDGAAASIADDVAAAAGMWAACLHFARHTEQMPMSCWAARDCPVQAASCRHQQWPGWARSGAAMWGSSADTRSASAACG